MTKRQTFVQQHGALCDELKEITARKNADYTSAGGDNPFHNFTQVENLGICSTSQGFLTRMTDKLSRIASLTATGEQMVKDESIEDTLKDLANYSLIMICELRSRKQTCEAQLKLDLVELARLEAETRHFSSGTDPMTEQIPWDGYKTNAKMQSSDNYRAEDNYGAEKNQEKAAYKPRFGG